MEHCIIDNFLFKKVLMEHLETGIKVKGVTFNKIIKIIVSPLWILKGEFFYFFESMFKRQLGTKSIPNEASKYLRTTNFYIYS